jgi:hypothetical protein
MNTKNIQPKTIWTDSGEKTATSLALINFSDYHFDGGEGIVTYKLVGVKDNGENPPSAEDLFLGYVTIPSAVINQWGQSDDVIWAYVSSSLQITLA